MNMKKDKLTAAQRKIVETIKELDKYSQFQQSTRTEFRREYPESVRKRGSIIIILAVKGIT